MKLRVLLPTISIFAALSASSHAAAIAGLYNTGVDNAGVPLADGTADPHYVLVTNPDAPTSTGAVVHDGTIFPIAGPWLNNSATSKWISPRLNTVASAGGAGAAGDYHYDLTFDLTGLDHTTAVITGDWTSDNAANLAGLGVYLNGAFTGAGNQQTGNFGGLNAFTVNSGFVAGVNVLSFRLNNSAVGYTGLRVENISGTADVIPEPSGAILLALGGTLLLRRRRK